MRVSGFTIVQNIRKYNYPFLESIRSILPICDEFVVNVGYSEDDTLRQVESINDPKIKIIQTKWDRQEHPADLLAYQTNVALAECRGDWAFYLQADEVIHEADLLRIKQTMEKYLPDDKVDALRFKWLHFFGSYYRYRIDKGWYQKQDRIIRNNGQVESWGDAFSFRRKDGKPLVSRHTGAFLYHYGWVNPGTVMTQKRARAEDLYSDQKLSETEKQQVYDYGDLNRFPPYFGSHPAVMRDLVLAHELSRSDWREIERRFWWHPAKILRLRYKTGKRIKEKIV